MLAASTAMVVTSAAAQTVQAAASSTANVPGKAQLGTWGVDLTSRDLSVKPGDDFQKYASGNWLAKTEIPADKPEVGSFYDVYDLSQDQLKALVTSADASSKYGALYQSMMDESRVEQLGIEPLKPDLAKVAAIASKADFARHMGTTDGGFGSALFAFDLEPDTADASMNSLYLYQAGLGMPNRDYYLEASFKPQRDAYRAYIERTFKAIGQPNPAAAADRVMAFETAIAQGQLGERGPARRRQDQQPDEQRRACELCARPRLDAFFEGGKIPAQKRMIVNENSAISRSPRSMRRRRCRRSRSGKPSTPPTRLRLI